MTGPRLLVDRLAVGAPAAHNAPVNRYGVLALVLLGCTLVLPLFALLHSGGKWRAAWEAWQESLMNYGILAAPGIVAALLMWLWGT